MKMTRVAIAAMAISMSSAMMIAQTATTTTAPGPTSRTIQQRKLNQQDRIAQGVKSGEMTARETGRVERQEAGINREERGMRAQDNGHLTAADKKTINQQQNVESKRIYRDKHNTAVR